jgi:hypothetical protein
MNQELKARQVVRLFGNDFPSLLDEIKGVLPV